VSARAYFRDAITADPSFTHAYAALGELELAREAYRDAEATFRVGLVRASPTARLWIGLARALDGLEASADADAVLAQADAQLREDPELLAFRAERAEQRGRWSLALAITRRLATRAAREGDVERATALRARARALTLLVGGLDPVLSRPACGSSWPTADPTDASSRSGTSDVSARTARRWPVARSRRWTRSSSAAATDRACRRAGRRGRGSPP
jgi:hypothetical protein